MSQPPHIRLVFDADNEGAEPGVDATLASAPPKISVEVTPPDWQLDLPFDGRSTGLSIVIASLEAMTGAQLRKLLADRRPDTVLDLREMIRFDLPGTNRGDIFKTFNYFNAHYVRDPLPWHSLTARDFGASDDPVSTRLIHEVVERSLSRVMIFVTRPVECRSIAAHLRRIMPNRLSVPFHIEETS